MATKYSIIAEAIRSDFPRMRAGGIERLPSEAALMKQYGVSRQTVRQAVSVLASEGLVVSRRGSGTYLTTSSVGRENEIAVIVTYADAYIFPALLAELKAGFSEYGYNTFIYETGNQVARERDHLQSLAARPPAGIVLEGSRTALPNPNADVLNTLFKARVPLLYLHGAHPLSEHTVCIGDDNYGGGYQLTKYLLDKGHQRIAGLFKSDDVQGIERYRGYVSALRDAALFPPDEHVLWFATEDRAALLESAPSERMCGFISGRLGDCTAVVCYNDEIAYALIKALLAEGKRVPQNVAVVSFDNSYYCSLGAIPITSLSHKPHAVGDHVCGELMRMIQGKPCASKALPWTLFERESSL